MEIKLYDTEDEWLEARRGKITGTRLKDLVNKRGGGLKIGVYEIIAERIAIPASGENVMDRGKRLEDEAIEKLSERIGLTFNTDRVIWHRDDDENIAISPDGFVAGENVEIAVEAKCLSSANHIKAWVEKQIPDEYEFQALQYFIVCDTLQTLYFAFYDPRMPVDLHWIEVQRDQAKVDEYLALERDVLVKIAAISDQLTF